jgi:Xaa-Pro dipeptidase
MSVDYVARRKKLESLEGVEVVALVPGANLTYHTGLHFHASERPLIALVAGGDLAFIVPALEVGVIEKHGVQGEMFVWTDKDGYQGAFDAAVRQLGLTGGRLGVDDNTMRLFEERAFLKADPTLQTIGVGQALLGIRAIKDADEIAVLRDSIGRTQDALDALLDWVQVGHTEREIGRKLDELLIAYGCQKVSFNALVQSGENSAFPHGAVSDRALQDGDLLLIDWGGQSGDYPADLTRTFVVGTPTDAQRKIHETVLAANRAAVKAAKPGVPCGAVDKAARDVIEAAGYGEYFMHRTGHGLGLEIHELPQMASGVEAVLQPGMVFTIEPGIYVPGVGGVRIEDNVVVTDSGVEVLSSFRRDWKLR